MFFKNEKLRYKRLLVIILPIFISILVLGFFAYTSFSGSLTQTIIKESEEYNIDSMNYQLRNNATDYQKELFKELQASVESGDDNAIVQCVAKNFIGDVYTWTNKANKWDVGGMQYVYSKYNTSIYYDFRDHLYQLLPMFIERGEGLMEVTNVAVNSCEKRNEPYSIENTDYEAYDVSCSIKLSGNENLIGRITHNQYLTIIKNNEKNGRFEIAESYGD